MKTYLKIGVPAAVTYGFAAIIGAAFGWQSGEAFAADMLALVSSAYAAPGASVGTDDPPAGPATVATLAPGAANRIRHPKRTVGTARGSL